jgi:hypothetical protein
MTHKAVCKTMERGVVGASASDKSKAKAKQGAKPKKAPKKK